MRIFPITTQHFYVKNYNRNISSHFEEKKDCGRNFYTGDKISFKWCTPHIQAYSDLNNKFESTIKKLLEKEAKILNDITQKNLLKETKYSLLDNAAAKATQLFSQYCNMQYTVAEMLPSYALATNKSLLDSIKQMEVFNDPVKTLIAINNVTKINTKAGIDKNTGKEYTKTQTEKAKAGTQLYVTAIMLEQLRNQIEQIENPQAKQQVMQLYGMVNDSIDSIYGKGTLDRIIALSAIGPNPTHEQKVASVKLIEEFDKNGQILVFSKEFEEGLKALIENENIRLEKTIENTGTGINSFVEIKLAYHTHAHNDQEHHHHHHENMTEDEHRLYHELEQKREKLKEKH